VALALLALAGACIAAFVIGTPAPSKRGDPAAREFLDAWRASRTATYVADYEFTRTLPDGRRLEQTTRTVQRPPTDRLVIGLGSVAGRLGGKIFRCAPAPAAAAKCTTGADADPYDAEVDGEIDTLEDYVRGDRPLYRVIAFAGGPGHCFRLDRALEVPSPPYGDHALFCFDDAGVPTRTVIQRPEATDELRATDVRTDVTDADLVIPTDIGAIVGVPGPTTTTTTPSTTTTTPLAN
jgi:hypothetical protein